MRFTVETTNIPRTLRDLGFVAWVKDHQHPDGIPGDRACSMSWHQSLLDAERTARALNLADPSGITER